MHSAATKGHCGICWAAGALLLLHQSVSERPITINVRPGNRLPLILRSVTLAMVVQLQDLLRENKKPVKLILPTSLSPFIEGLLGDTRTRCSTCTDLVKTQGIERKWDTWIGLGYLYDHKLDSAKLRLCSFQQLDQNRPVVSRGRSFRVLGPRKTRALQ